jgi:hypothetical protein
VPGTFFQAVWTRIAVGREHRIGRAVDHERGHGDRRQGRTGTLVRRQELVVARTREIAGAPDVAARELARGSLVERTPSAGQHALVADEVLDHGLRARPVDLGVEAREGVGPPWKLELDRHGEGGADQRERRDAIGEVERHPLRERSSHRHPDEMRDADPVRIQDPDGVREQIVAGVLGAPRLVGGRPAGVPVVVADHQPRAALAHDPLDRGSDGAPNDSVHNSTPFASIIRSATTGGSCKKGAWHQSCSGVCEHVFVSVKGSAYPRFRRALEAGNPLIVRAAAAELDAPLSLADALAVTLVLAADSLDLLERAAARWTARLALETPGLTLADAQMAAAAFAQIAAGRTDAGADALACLLERSGLSKCAAELAAWRTRTP